MKTCYLCGKEILTRRESSKDHIMPRQQFKALIDKEKENLFTLLVHNKCNGQYQKDEIIYGEYMRALTGNIAEYNLNAGDIFTKNLSDSGKHPANYELTRRSISHKPIYTTEEGIHHKLYYTDQCLTSEQSKSINNIIWKIVRGLYYLENKKVLRKEVMYQIIPKRMPMICYRGYTGIVGAIACFPYFDLDQLRQFYQAQADLEATPNQPKTPHSKAFNYRYNDHTNRGEEIWELQYCEDIIQIVKYKKSQIANHQ